MIPLLYPHVTPFYIDTPSKQRPFETRQVPTNTQPESANKLSSQGDRCAEEDWVLRIRSLRRNLIHMVSDPVHFLEISFSDLGVLLDYFSRKRLSFFSFVLRVFEAVVFMEKLAFNIASFRQKSPIQVYVQHNPFHRAHAEIFHTGATTIDRLFMITRWYLLLVP